MTGPAELALDTARTLEEYAPELKKTPQGLTEEPIESSFLSSRHPKDPHWLEDLARQRGGRVVSLPRLQLQKHFRLRSFFDARILGHYLNTQPVDLIHCHLHNDHMVAAIARRLGFGGVDIPIVRTLYDGEPVRETWRQRWTLSRCCEHLVCFSPVVKEALQRGRLKIDPNRISLLEPPIDTERFSPDRKDLRERGRKQLGIPPEAFTAGIVARMQRHRRFAVLLQAIKLAATRIPGFRFVIIGRGTHQETVAREPVRQLGLSDIVSFAGYISGDDYVAALLSFDVKLFLVPGSDGTCRAVREALAAGIPVLAARRGMLPEIVRDRVTGRIVEDRPDHLADALVDLASNRERLKQMAVASRKDAIDRFSYHRHISALLNIYGEVLGKSKIKSARLA